MVNGSCVTRKSNKWSLLEKFSQTYAILRKITVKELYVTLILDTLGKFTKKTWLDPYTLNKKLIVTDYE